jgi:hypothetical protein
VFGALRERLGFDVIGCTVMGAAANGRCGMEQLCLSVLTSDDVRFATAYSEEITAANVEAATADAYARARAELSADPSLVFALGPIMPDVSGEEIMNVLTRQSGGAPVFGTLANDTSLTYIHGRICRNGEGDRYRVAVLLMEGDVDARFFVTAISEKNIQNRRGIVTDADGYLLKRIDDRTIPDYLESLGVRVNGLMEMTTLPFLVDYGDGTKPVALSMYSVSEKGAFCGGKIPVGASIAFAEVNAAGVMETAERTVRQALDYARDHHANGIFAIPCLTRCLVVSPNSENEMRKSLELVNGEFPFFLMYSGGEICPVYNDAGQTVNRFHNLTYTLVVL